VERGIEEGGSNNDLRSISSTPRAQNIQKDAAWLHVISNEVEDEVEEKLDGVEIEIE
jgi:hypothetical protein